MLQALPQAAFFLLQEAAAGGAIALLWIHLRGEVSRGFTLFTGACFLVLGALAIWLRSVFPPILTAPDANLWFQVERFSAIAFVLLLALLLILLRSGAAINRVIGMLVPLAGLVSVWSAALVSNNLQLLGFGPPLAALTGAMALGSALTGLSLGHWYLVSPTLSVRPLIQVTFVCIGALAAQTVLLVLLLVLPGVSQDGVRLLFGEDVVFLGVRVVFGLFVPLLASVMTWRTARIRSLDSATGLLYIVAALILAGEIAARTLYFITGVAT